VDRDAIKIELLSEMALYARQQCGGKLPKVTSPEFEKFVDHMIQKALALGVDEAQLGPILKELAQESQKVIQGKR
jgi:16S rRNA U1498 N3-methylase RsmE